MCTYHRTYVMFERDLQYSNTQFSFSIFKFFLFFFYKLQLQYMYHT